MNHDLAASLDFTNGAEEVFYDVVDDPRFHSQDQTMIFNALQDALTPISFGDHLKRYIYQKTEMKEDFAGIPLSLYQEIIADAFRDTQTQVSFSAGKTTLRAAVKNWLTQQTVSRETVLILGFGLSMMPEDVNMFLTKVLREHRLSPKDPLEVVCSYCYQHRLRFLKCQELLKKSGDSELSRDVSRDMLDSTLRLETAVTKLSTEEALLQYVRNLRSLHGNAAQGATARAWFDRLFKQAQELTAAFYNGIEKDDTEVKKGHMGEALANDDSLYDYQKKERLDRLADQEKKYRAEEMGPADLEKILCSAIPSKDNGNYLSTKKSMLYRQFDGKRFNRKHMSDIFQGKSAITRFDLITMNFYNMAMGMDPSEKALIRFQRFMDSTNRILTDSSMGTLYIANPYDCFVIMCMLTDDPLGTYADVWELSYHSGQKDEET